MEKRGNQMIQTEYNSIVEWCQTCPELYELWAVSGSIDLTDENVIDITATAPLYSNITTNYADGETRVSGRPTEDYWEAITISLYRPFVTQDNDFNLSTYNQAVAICEWFIEQQNSEQLPIIDGKKIHFIEVLSQKPIKAWTDSQTQINAYNAVIRLHMDNPAKRVDYVI